MKKLCFVPVLVAVLAPGCRGGATLVIENPHTEGKVAVQVVDSSLGKDSVFAKVVITNNTDKVVVADCRLVVLSDGLREWSPRASSRHRVQIDPKKTSSAVKLDYRESDSTQASYDLIFKPGAFRSESDTGEELEVPSLRLSVKKVEVKKVEK